MKTCKILVVEIEMLNFGETSKCGAGGYLFFFSTPCAGRRLSTGGKKTNQQLGRCTPTPPALWAVKQREMSPLISPYVKCEFDPYMGSVGWSRSFLFLRSIWWPVKVGRGYSSLEAIVALTITWKHEQLIFSTNGNRILGCISSPFINQMQRFDWEK